ncbi:MAG: HlyD family type I secretion periplasmic adaptor subunit [Pseudomonadota bacterium]
MNQMQIAGPGGGEKPNDGWDGRWYIRFGLVCVLILGGGFGGWAATASLAGAVIATGQLRVEANRQVVQHPDGGVVAEILSRDGDTVEAGDVLIKLDASQLRSQLAALESQYFEILARLARLQAVQVKSDEIAFDQELLDAAAQNPEIQRLIDGQVSLFIASRVSMSKEMQIMDQRKVQLSEQIIGTEAQIQATKKSRDLIAKELADQERLLKQGLARATQVLALQREEARLEGETGQLIQQVAQLKSQISETEIEQLRMFDTMREEAIAESRELGFRRVEMSENRAALKEQLSRLDIRAPRSGTVLESTIHALKSVIRPAEPILYIVPSDSDMVVEARVETINRDQVWIGQDTVLRFSAFNTRTTPEIFGKVRIIADAETTDDQSGLSYYTTEVRINEGEIEKLDGQELVAGMPVEVYIQTGERTPIEYLMKPVTDYFTTAWREE